MLGRQALLAGDSYDSVLFMHAVDGHSLDVTSRERGMTPHPGPNVQKSFTKPPHAARGIPPPHPILAASLPIGQIVLPRRPASSLITWLLSILNQLGSLSGS
jgi:hypothetical protein